MPLIVIGAAGLAWLLFVSEPGSHFLTSFLSPTPAPGAPVGRLVRGNGAIKRIHGGDVQELGDSIAEPVELYDGDRIETDKGASAVLELNSQDEFQIDGLSSVHLQLWNDQDPKAPVYMTLMAGDARHIKAGLRGRAYVVRQGRLYLPSQRPAEKPLALTVLKAAPLDMQIAEKQSGSDFEPDQQTPEDAPPSGLSMEPETLSNEYIDEMIASRQSQLQKCWLSRLKDRPDLKGRITLQFEIGRRGKVRELRIVDTTVTDDVLQKCVLNVVERINFRSFKGPEISLSYPITFE